MNRTPHPLLVAAGLTAAALFVGCADTDLSPPDAAVEPDAGVDPAPDAVTPAADRGSGLEIVAAGACSGYTLFAAPGPNASDEQQITLVDMKGRVVQRWAMWAMPPLMLPNGSVLGALEQRDIPAYLLQDAVDVTQLTWDGQREWSFTGWDDDGTHQMMARQHHDLQREGSPVGYWSPQQQPLISGKTLILGHLTRLVPGISDKALTDDVFYEVDAAGQLTGFRWYAADHFDEYGFDETARKAIYDSPGWNSSRGTGDLFHINSVSRLGRNRWFERDGDGRFHPENLIFGSRNANFIAIVDHASGKIVWRLGPEILPGQPGEEIGQLVGQHHPHMIPYGLPGAGNILIFDNGGVSGYGGAKGYPRHSRGYSRVVEFDPVTLSVVWEHGSSDSDDPHFFFSYMISGAQRLPNGNTLITDGANGRIFEITPEHVTVWSYLSPFESSAGVPMVYRATRVPPEWVPAAARTERYPAWSELYGP